RPGEGSTFWFTLPLVLDKNAPVEVPRGDLNHVRILIVDDHQINRRVYSEMLSSRNIENNVCASGADALHILHQAVKRGEPYRMAIVDYHMPEMDGITLAKAIKADPVLKETVLVMLSSVGKQGEARKMTDAGFAAYLVKPVHREKLIDVLTGVWSANNAHKSNQETPDPPFKTPPVEEITTNVAQLFGNLRILVAEDNLVNQKVVSLLLKKLGVGRTDIVSNGLEALYMLQRSEYDLIFMDCQMPVMGGLEATREIRAREEKTNTHIPIVAMTANAMKGDRENCLNAGMDDYIPKPVKKELVVEMLIKYSKSPAAV
ncbi:MAG: response regulator, partial [Planctomycetes bacterium]|nr:response regulator [Planctomycetota bacterium]